MPTAGPVALPAAARKNPRTEHLLDLKDTYGLWSGSEIVNLEEKQLAPEYVVDDLIAISSINLLVGDSGIGKSPLAYQMGLAVAAGLPWLGMPTKAGTVLFLDYENQGQDVSWILGQQCRYLGLKSIPERFTYWPLPIPPPQEKVEEIIREFAPRLVIIDSLRSFSPEMETQSRKAVEQLQRLRAMMEDETAFLLIHHLGKQKAPAANLEEGDALNWLRRAAGSRALVNQSDTRLALAQRQGHEQGQDQGPKEERGADLVLSGHLRTRGEVGPYLLRRSWDAHGEPAGYERFEPLPALIENADQEAAFNRLSGTFSFGDAKRELDRSPAATNWFIQKLLRLGLAQKTGHGVYRKHISCTSHQTMH